MVIIKKDPFILIRDIIFHSYFLYIFHTFNKKFIIEYAINKTLYIRTFIPVVNNYWYI